VTAVLKSAPKIR